MKWWDRLLHRGDAVPETEDTSKQQTREQLRRVARDLRVLNRELDNLKPRPQRQSR